MIANCQCAGLQLNRRIELAEGELAFFVTEEIKTLNK